MDAEARAESTTRLGVVVGVDGTGTALNAVRWAAAEALCRGLPLRVVHAAPYAAGPPSEPGRQRARDVLAMGFTIARRAQPGLSVTSRYTEAEPVPALLAASRRARLLVLGTGIGATAMAVTGRASCPVVVVRGAGMAKTADRPVLIGMGAPALDLPVDALALTFAFADARRHDGRVVVLHARHGSGFMRARRDEAARVADWDRLADTLDPWSSGFPDVPIELSVVHGSPTSTLLEASVHARLVVLGAHRHGAANHAIFGSTSGELLRRSPVPIAMVNPECVLSDEQADGEESSFSRLL